MKINKLLILFLFPVLFFSCASLNFNNPGVGRVKKYYFTHADIPLSFDNFRITFLSDFHYKSLFTEKRLQQLIKTVNKTNPDILLLGGDYHNGCEYVPELFRALSQIKTTYGTYAVMGNHDYYACYDTIVNCMQHAGIHLLEHSVDSVRKENDYIIIAGVRDPFDLNENGKSPTLNLSDEDFVILLAHTPDYAEDGEITHTDLVLSGHTHGGQVTLFGLYAPQTSSKYGQRFRTGLKYNSDGIPVIITNGLGTSRRNIRMFAPSEVVQIILHSTSKTKQ